ncbi:MAG: response regulator [Leptolyngbya sp. SIO4C1]|nr:response regulator [Leptolyngbya sp. SIO4C1]
MIENVACLANTKILVVDSNLDARELLKILFETYDAQPVLAATAREALARVKLTQPRLLISEIKLIDESGYSLIQKVRDWETGQQTRHVPAIALTVYASSEDRLRALAAGFCQHITKPYSISQLLASVVNLIEA